MTEKNKTQSCLGQNICIDDSYAIDIIFKSIRYFILFIPLIIGMTIGAIYGKKWNEDKYKNLKKPEYNPPNYVFGIVWPILYLLIGGIYSYALYDSKCIPDSISKCAKIIYYKDFKYWIIPTLALIFNFLYIPVFFGENGLFNGEHKSYDNLGRLILFQNYSKNKLHGQKIEYIPDKIFKSLSIKDKQNMNIYNCSLYDTIRKISIDSLAYLGIILNIGRSTIKYGYITGVVNGFVIIILSLIFAVLTLVQFIMQSNYYKYTKTLAIIALVPYILWLSFASYLSYNIYILN